MIIKIIGAVLVVCGCGGVGFHLASSYRKEEKSLHHLIDILKFMECELNFHLTALPVLCKQVATEYQSEIGNIFLKLSEELEMQTSPKPEVCMVSAIAQTKALPPITKSCMLTLGKSIGHFDLEGQIKGLEAVIAECTRQFDMLIANRDNRIRSYQTLGICAGAALAILFV
ncbi:MAG: hypothetical protein E7421_01240 [Ruminococcaceae bacterium]|nr:hypothetical protein [Oscillospiraceae bacterium]